MNECRLLGLRLLYSLVRRGLVVAFFRLAESTRLQLRQLLSFCPFHSEPYIQVAAVI